MSVFYFSAVAYLVYNGDMHILKEFIKFVGKIILATLVIGALFFAYYEYQTVIQKKIKAGNLASLISLGEKSNEVAAQAPAEENPQNANFVWEYAGKNYSIQETLYGSTYNFYRSSPKEFMYNGKLENNWEEQYFKMFLQENDSEKIFNKVAMGIQAAGKKNGLNNDQIVELVLAFVQAIKYDDAKAGEIVAGNKSALTSYPYETLYLQRGVCADKSFLAAMLLRELGYGTALFAYDAENHMALGIQCPMQYSSYDSGYCYAETTSVGIRIGVIPDLDKGTNRAKDLKRLGYLDYSQSDQFNEKKLGAVKIYQKTTGKEYGGIANTIKISQNIEKTGKAIVALRKEIDSLKSYLESDQKALAALKKEMDKLEKAKDIAGYNKMVPIYNKRAQEAKDNVESYNAKIKEYNKLVDQYNSLIVSF